MQKKENWEAAHEFPVAMSVSFFLVVLPWLTLPSSLCWQHKVPLFVQIGFAVQLLPSVRYDQPWYSLSLSTLESCHNRQRGGQFSSPLITVSNPYSTVMSRSKLINFWQSLDIISPGIYLRRSRIEGLWNYWKGCGHDALSPSQSTHASSTDTRAQLV